MTVKSMTGYGRGETRNQSRIWTVEVRCVNNRFLDAKIKLPRDYSAFEDQVRKIIGEYHQRGRVDLALSVTGDFSDLVEIDVDTALASAYKNSLGKLADHLNIDGALNVTALAGYPDVLVRVQKQENLDTIRTFVETALREALEGCREMRQREGEALADDLVSRLNYFSEVLVAVEKRIPELIKYREEGLKERLEKLLDNVNIDPMRLAQEVAIIADKTDVTEEMVRIRSHISQFKEIITISEEAVGRKLDFLIQEFLREVNTMASKINDAEIAHMTVDLKSELEKMREQVQNIE